MIIALLAQIYVVSAAPDSSCRLLTPVALPTSAEQGLVKKGYRVELASLSADNTYESYVQELKVGDLGFQFYQNGPTILRWRSPLSQKVYSAPATYLSMVNAKTIAEIHYAIPTCQTLRRPETEILFRRGHIRQLAIAAANVLINLSSGKFSPNPWAPIFEFGTAGEFIIEFEQFLTNIKNPNLESEIARLKAGYRNLLENLRPLQTPSTSITFKRVETTLKQTAFNNYILTRDLMSDFFDATDPGGACTAQSALWVALGKDLALEQTDSQVLGLQDLMAHRRAVLFDANNNQSYDLTYAKEDLPNNGPIYRPEYLLWLLINTANRELPGWINEFGQLTSTRFALKNLVIRWHESDLQWLADKALFPLLASVSAIQMQLAKFREGRPSRKRIYDASAFSGGHFTFSIPSQRARVNSSGGEGSSGSGGGGSWSWLSGWSADKKEHNRDDIMNRLKSATANSTDSVYKKIARLTSLNDWSAVKKLLLVPPQSGLREEAHFALAPSLAEGEPAGERIQLETKDVQFYTDSAQNFYIGPSRIWLTAADAEVYRHMNNSQRLQFLFRLSMEAWRDHLYDGLIERFITAPTEYWQWAESDRKRLLGHLQSYSTIGKNLSRFYQTDAAPALYGINELIRLPTQKIAEKLEAGGVLFLDEIQQKNPNEIDDFFSSLQLVQKLFWDSKDGSGVADRWLMRLLIDPNWAIVPGENQTEPWVQLYQKALEVYREEKRLRGKDEEKNSTGMPSPNAGVDGNHDETQDGHDGRDSHSQPGVAQGLEQGPLTNIRIEIMDESTFQMLMARQKERNSTVESYLNRPIKRIDPKILMNLVELSRNLITSHAPAQLLVRPWFSSGFKEAIPQRRINGGNNALEDVEAAVLRLESVMKNNVNSYGCPLSEVIAGSCRNVFEPVRQSPPGWVKVHPALEAAFRFNPVFPNPTNLVQLEIGCKSLKPQFLQLGDKLFTGTSVFCRNQYQQWLTDTNGLHYLTGVKNFRSIFGAPSGL